MVLNINKSISVCDANIHVDSISVSDNAGKEKTYYQHRHPGIEIHYVVNGQFEASCADQRFNLSPNTVFIIPAGTYHDITPTANPTLKLSLSFMIQKNDNKAPGCSRNAFYDTYTNSIPVISDLKASEAEAIFKKMIALLGSCVTDIYLTDKLLTLCASLLLELIPYIIYTGSNQVPGESLPRQEDVSFKIDSFIGRNFMRNDAKSRMADDLYISPRQLQRIIRKNYGMSYREKLAETRIKIAIDLLRNTDMSICKISEILGYSCSANFSAFVKRATGKTPTKIRKEHQ